MQYVIGMDAGTHSIRGLLASVETGRVEAISRCSYYRECSSGVQELNVDLVWDAFLQIQNELLADLTEGDQVLGIGITHQRGTVVPVDENAKPLHFAFCDSDGRYLIQKELAKYGLSATEYYEKSGCPFVSFNGLAKILWCHTNMPELFKRASAWLSLQDYLISRLVGRIVQSEGSTLRNGIYDIKHRQVTKALFSPDVINTDFLNVPMITLGQSAGMVKSAAGLSRFLEGAQVIAVPGDQPAAVIGVGALSEHEIAVNLGTTFVASMYSCEPIADPAEMITQEILPDGCFAMEFGTGAGGQFTDWAAKLMFGKVPDTEKEWLDMDDMAGTAPLGSDGLSVVPLLWQVTSPGVMGKISNINMVHERRHFVRAIYEGLAYELKLSILRLEQVMGKKAETIKVFGGFGSNKNFLRILSFVLGRTVVSSCQNQMSAFGSLLTTFYGVGRFKDIFEASRFADRSQNVFVPETGKEVSFYERAFSDYQKRRQ